jgi:hypothetical protein
MATNTRSKSQNQISNQTAISDEVFHTAMTDPSQSDVPHELDKNIILRSVSLFVRSYKKLWVAVSDSAGGLWWPGYMSGTFGMSEKCERTKRLIKTCVKLF